ncbi:MAG: NAD(P) transhydrogenase subunit alpha [Bifidobacteriaceae bacterium]|jgi:NAD(P) transhydrogenase subunit alpha|nr:NAD(P) transhydrogenase subunit alpha [Bifidobacteriaceae bacterium]
MISVGLVPLNNGSSQTKINNFDKRVMLTPTNVKYLKNNNIEVYLTRQVGLASGFNDEDYKQAGGKIVTINKLFDSDILLFLSKPDIKALAKLKPNQIIIGYLKSTNSQIGETLYKKNLIGIDIELLPRMISSAQNMDVLTSQSSLAGYCAVIKAAELSPIILPMISSAAGTIKPAKVLILGAGIAGLQAIATAKRLGAKVTAFDIRPNSKIEIESVGAKFLDLSIVSEQQGGYAKQLDKDQQNLQQKYIDKALQNYDIVITTAKVPGAKPPLLITANGVMNLPPGAVALDMAATKQGGNIDGSQDGKTLITPNGAYIVGASNLTNEVPHNASTLLGNNIQAILKHFIKDGQFKADYKNPIDKALIITNQLSKNKGE